MADIFPSNCASEHLRRGKKVGGFLVKGFPSISSFSRKGNRFVVQVEVDLERTLAMKGKEADKGKQGKCKERSLS